MKILNLGKMLIAVSLSGFATVGCGEFEGNSDNSNSVLAEGSGCDISSPKYDPSQCLVDQPNSSTGTPTTEAPAADTPPSTTTPPSTGGSTRTGGGGGGGIVEGCPTGIRCLERPWPIIKQEVITMPATTILAIKITTTNADEVGLLSTMYTTGNTAARQLSISSKAGDFTGGGNSRCVDAGLEVTSTSWAQVEAVTDARGVCQIPANAVMWINIRFTNCSAGSSCSFYLKSN